MADPAPGSRQPRVKKPIRFPAVLRVRLSRGGVFLLVQAARAAGMGSTSEFMRARLMQAVLAELEHEKRSRAARAAAMRKRLIGDGGPPATRPPVP